MFMENRQIAPHLIRGDAKVFNTINVYTKGKFVFNMQV